MAMFHGHSLCPLMIPMLFSYFLIGIPNRMAPLLVDVCGALGGFVAASDVVNGLLGGAGAATTTGIGAAGDGAPAGAAGGAGAGAVVGGWCCCWWCRGF